VNLRSSAPVPRSHDASRLAKTAAQVDWLHGDGLQLLEPVLAFRARASASLHKNVIERDGDEVLRHAGQSAEGVPS
jgi:hypothetical protein